MQQSGAALQAGRHGRVPSKGFLCEKPQVSAIGRFPIPPPLQRGRSGGGAVASRMALQTRHPHRPRCARPLPPLKRGKDRFAAVRPFNNISFFSTIFLDTAGPAPYIGPVNARSAPAAAGRRPRKDANEETGAGPCGTVPPVPLSGPPPRCRVPSGVPAWSKKIWKISYLDYFLALPNGVFPMISRGYGCRAHKKAKRKKLNIH